MDTTIQVVQAGTTVEAAKEVVPTWNISSTTKPHDDFMAADFCDTYAQGLRNPCLSQTLIVSVCTPFGALTCANMREIPRQSVIDAVVDANLNPMIVRNIESKLFSPGKGFSSEPQQVVQTDDAEVEPKRGGYRKLKFTDLGSGQPVTELLGGVASVQRLKFPQRTLVLLRQSLCGKAKPDISTALTVVFQFYLCAFEILYMDYNVKVKLGFLLHAIDATTTPENWSEKLARAFNNKRQNRFSRPLAFHPDDFSAGMVQKLKALGIDARVSTPPSPL